MNNRLKQFILTNMLLQQIEIDEVLSYFKIKNFKKNSMVIFKGDVCREFYFVNKGCIRTYYTTTQGTQKTRHIALDGSVGTALASFISQQPSFEYVDTLEDSELFSIHYNHFFHLVGKFPAFALFYSKLLASAYVQQSNRIETIVSCTAKERYKRLLRDKPYFVKRLSNKILASYLDIAQETLSRLKSDRIF